jgi:Zn-dependent oligopeptidase
MFGLKFQKMEPPYKWVDDLELYGVLDSETGEPMGMFYLDMFPREGKFNHFAQFSLIAGKEFGDGVYQRPCVALICNFPHPQKMRPLCCLITKWKHCFMNLDMPCIPF